MALVKGRITPAHAGKTSTAESNRSLWADHPRACGENILQKHRLRMVHGSPPRMRGKQSQKVALYKGIRITPAHAGKTGTGESGHSSLPDHPRACGENNLKTAIYNYYNGSPPRMRGKRLQKL